MTQDTYIHIVIPSDVVPEKLSGETMSGQTWYPFQSREDTKLTTALFKGDKRSIGDVFVRYNGTVDGCIDITFGIEKIGN